MRLTFAHCTNDADRAEMEIWLEGLEQGLFNNDNLFVDTSSCLEFKRSRPCAPTPFTPAELRTILGNDGSAWLTGPTP